jgi:uncharacterized SAM-dependent methyltransferase
LWTVEVGSELVVTATTLPEGYSGEENGTLLIWLVNDETKAILSATGENGCTLLGVGAGEVTLTGRWYQMVDGNPVLLDPDVAVNQVITVTAPD